MYSFSQDQTNKQKHGEISIISIIICLESSFYFPCHCMNEQQVELQEQTILW